MLNVINNLEIESWNKRDISRYCTIYILLAACYEIIYQSSNISLHVSLHTLYSKLTSLPRPFRWLTSAPTHL